MDSRGWRGVAMGGVLRTRKSSATFAEIQQAAAAGESWAREALAAEYLPRLTAFAAARGAREPEGIADVSLLAILRRLDELHFDAPEQMWAYLCRTARSRTIDEHRATKPVDLFDDGSTIKDLDASLQPFEEHIVERDYVDGLLSPLTNEQREVLEMRFIDDLSIVETASRTGRSPEAVKGLQRRAINAILAAAAIIAILIALRGFGGADEDNRRIDDPARPTETTETPAPEPNPQPGPQQDLRPTPQPEGEPETQSGETQRGEIDGSEVDGGEVDGGEVSAVQQPDHFRITVGSNQASPLDASGPVGDEPSHGTRVYCTVSHFSPNPVEPGSTRIHWGNTMAGTPEDNGDVASLGRSTCEGGLNDRSAYSMPALFDESGQLVLPESIAVEYKSFAGLGFDRTSIQPIPAGLQLQTHESIAEAGDRFGSVDGDERSMTVQVSFPNCVAVTAEGTPVLAAEEASHLSHTTSEKTTNNCPASHPYRIPQLSYRLVYQQSFSSAWTLSSANQGAADRTISAGFVSGWEPQTMNTLVRCNIEMRQCEFAAGSQTAGGNRREQLPGRFTSPQGDNIYRHSGALVAEADRTPFGAAIPGSDSSRAEAIGPIRP